MATTLSAPCDELHKITVHNSKSDAESWLKECLERNGVEGYDGCSILVFYKTEGGLVRALKPHGKRSDRSNNLRIVGAENQKKRPFSEKVYAALKVKNERVPRFGDLEGNEIIPGVPYGILIVYEKRPGQSVGKFLYQILRKLKKDLAEKATLSEKNSSDSETIDLKKLTELCYGLALGSLDGKDTGDPLRSGRIYHISQEGKDCEVYRYTFKRDSKNPVELALLNEERADSRLAAKAEIRAAKRINHHYAAILRSSLKVIFVGILVSPTCGALAFVFLMPIPIPLVAPIVAAFVAVLLAAIILIRGICKVAAEHKPTVEYGKVSFTSSLSDSHTGPLNDCGPPIRSRTSYPHKSILKSTWSDAKVGADTEDPFTTAATDASCETSPHKSTSQKRHVSFFEHSEGKGPKDLEPSIPTSQSLLPSNPFGR